MVDFAKRNRRAAILKQKRAAQAMAAGLPVAGNKVAKPRKVFTPHLVETPARRVSDLSPSPPVQARKSAPYKSLSAQAVPSATAKPKAPRAGEKLRSAVKDRYMQGLASPSDKRITDPLNPTCKPRPSTSKGNGTSRPFIPWCK